MNKSNIDKKGLIIGLTLTPYLFGAWVAFTYHQDKELPGIVDYKSGYTQKAITELQQYLSDHPCTEQHSFVNSKSELAQKYLGLAYLDTNQNQQAVIVFSNPCISSDNSQYNLGIALMHQGKLQEARLAFKKCVDMGGGKFSDEALKRAAQAKLDSIDKLQ